MKYDIKKYDNTINLDIWENFIETSINGTIFHTRKFLSYHNDKFIDCSIMIYKEEEIVCVIPCCKNNDLYFSHSGSTYGGPVFSKSIKNIIEMNAIIDMIITYYENKLELRLANEIYHNISTNDIIYLLSKKLKCTLELSWVFKVSDNFIDNIKNRRNKKNLMKMIDTKNGFTCKKYESIEDYKIFYNVLESLLLSKYKKKPTHSLNELILLKSKIHTHMELYMVKDTNNNIYGGIIIIKVTKICWYTMYIAKNMNYNSSNNVSIMYIIYELLIEARKNGVEFIDYGITTENNGNKLNKGLSVYKEKSLCGKPIHRYLFLK